MMQMQGEGTDWVDAILSCGLKDGRTTASDVIAPMEAWATLPARITTSEPVSQLVARSCESSETRKVR